MALCAIGFLNIFSVQFDPDKSGAFSFTSEYGKQLIFILTALVLGLSILLFDAKFFSVFAPIIYGVTILLLLTVLVVGRNVGGNQAWIPLGSFRLQPLQSQQSQPQGLWDQGGAGMARRRAGTVAFHAVWRTDACSAARRAGQFAARQGGVADAGRTPRRLYRGFC